jgi:hypothetical protein
MSLIHIQHVIDTRYRQLRLALLRGEMSTLEVKARMHARLAGVVDKQLRNGQLTSRMRRSLTYSAMAEARAEVEWLNKDGDDE